METNEPTVDQKKDKNTRINSYQYQGDYLPKQEELGALARLAQEIQDYAKQHKAKKAL